MASRERYQDIAELRDILTDLYPERSSAKRLVADAGLDTSTIDFEGAARDRWHGILLEADKHLALDSILSVALMEYPRSELLRAVAERRAAEASSVTPPTPTAGDPRRPTEATEGYDLFVALPPQQADVAWDVVHALRARQLRLFLDRDHAAPGDPKATVWERGIDDSLGGLLFLSKATHEELWADDLRARLARRRVRRPGFRIVPVRLDDCPVPDALVGLQPLDLRGKVPGQPMTASQEEALDRLADVLTRLRRGQVGDAASGLYAQMRAFVARIAS